MVRGVKVPITPELLAKLEASLEDGMSYKHVGEAHGVPRQLVARHFPGRGWTREQATALGTLMKHHNEKMRVLERKGKIVRPHDPTSQSEANMLDRRFAGASNHENVMRLVS